MRKTGLFCLFLLAFAGFFSVRAWLSGLPPQGASSGRIHRIASLAPSVTETLYGMGLWDRVAGVTRYCSWPPEAGEKPKVSEFSRLNLEALVRVRPDAAVLPGGRDEDRAILENLGIRVFSLDTRSVADYLASVEELGRQLGEEAGAKKLADRFRTTLGFARLRAEGRKRPRVLAALMEPGGAGTPVSQLTVIGPDGFYGDLLRLAGGENAYSGHMPFPRVSREAVLTLNPEVVIAFIEPSDRPEDVLRRWQPLKSVRAVQTGRISVLPHIEHTIPGPRSIRTLEAFSRALFPEEAPAAAPGAGS